MMNPDMLYVISPEEQNRETLTEILTAHPEIKFVSFMGVDFAGNDTDEKVPISLFLKDIDGFLEGMAAQTDGSSVVLTGIATLNNARVDMKIDSSVNWYIDYNYEHFDSATGRMVGTLRIPCFLVHNNVRVDSRSILHDTLDYVEKELLELFKKHPQIAGLEHISGEDIEKIIFTCATELEFWVKSPREDAPIEALSSSQMMQEQYWQRCRGNVRTALEQTVEMLEAYGLGPEMGHKECGGVRGQIDDNGHMTHVMEQLEVDWKYSYGVQTADNELLARIIVKEIFRLNGLEVSFQAKPVPGVAGSGEHTHVGIAAKMKNGKVVNLFAPKDMHTEFLSAVGYGSMMGLLKNYEVINPFISSTIDSLNRLKPGFEAPVCIVTSLGLSPEVPSRNRTILAGLIRDIDSPMATRIEMRSPNPYTNTYLAIAAFYISMLDGIKACVESGKTLKEMENELSKKAGDEGFYLEKDREYRSEHDVFEDYNEEERARLFGKPPATVWENMCAIKNYPEKIAVLTTGNILKKEFIESFAKGALIRWQTELLNRIIPEYHKEICLMKKLHDDDNHTTHDAAMWEKIAAMRNTMAKDVTEQPSLFTMTREAFARGDFDAASNLQLEMAEIMQKLKAQYNEYQHNIID
ncbi:glutamate--ammonia ligase catalytic domain protein [Phascolarctobacterium sp. CAG:266]|nr:glutamate--ammonia ligase catalytic domain protein [Phascolarctobacterium sp. CAG:266]